MFVTEKVENKVPYSVDRIWETLSFVATGKGEK